MQNSPLNHSSHFPAPSLQLAVTRFISRTYLWMCMGLLLTGITSVATLSSEFLMKMILETQGVFFGIIILQVALVFLIGILMKKPAISGTLLSFLFLLYSALTGLTFSSLGLVYTGESISQTFFIASGMFGALALFGTVTRKDLSPIGAFFGMGVVGLILLGALNLFLHSEALSMGLATVGVFIFAGLTAYDAQMIRSLAYEYIQSGDQKSEQKAMIMGALILYLDFINLFLNLLKLLGKKRDR